MNQVIEAVQIALHSIQNASRTIKITLQVSLDAVVIFLSLVSAVLLRTETIRFLNNSEFFTGSVIILCGTLFAFARIGLYRAFTRYLSSETAVLIAAGTAISAVLLLLIKLILLPLIPWPVVIIFFSLSFIGLCGSRSSCEPPFALDPRPTQKSRCLWRWQSRRTNPTVSQGSPEYRARIVIDDDPQLQGNSYLVSV